MSASQWKITVFLEITMDFFCRQRKETKVFAHWCTNGKNYRKAVVVQNKISSECCFTKKGDRSRLGLLKEIFLCNNENYTVLLHFECFHQLVESKCDNHYLFTDAPNGTEFIAFAFGRRCYNSMKKSAEEKGFEKLKTVKQWLKQITKRNYVYVKKNAETNNWSSDGTELFLVNY